MKYSSDRRQFFRYGLVGAAGLVASACSSSEREPEVVALYSPNRVIAAGQNAQRVPFAIVEHGTKTLNDQSALPVTIKFDGNIVEELAVPAHIAEHDHVVTEEGDGHQHADTDRYFPLRTKFEQPGIYDFEMEVGGAQVGITVQAFDKEEVQGILPGQEFVSVKTPTDDDSAGIDRVCTRFEHCGLHGTSVDALLGNKPFIMLIATPAFCATAFCGPVLETLLKVEADFPGVEFLHVEVYKNTDEVDGNFEDPRIELADYMPELGLDFEPVLYAVDADGVLRDRLDNIFDEQELRAALGLIA